MNEENYEENEDLEVDPQEEYDFNLDDDEVEEPKESSFVTKEDLKEFMSEIKEMLSQNTKSKVPSVNTMDLLQYSPEADTLDAFDLREKMIKEIYKLYPDMPEEAEDEVRTLMKTFRTKAQLVNCYNEGHHKLLADATCGKYKREKRYSRMAPAKSEQDYSNVTSSKLFKEIKEIEKLTGVPFTKDEIKEMLKVGEK